MASGDILTQDGKETNELVDKLVASKKLATYSQLGSDIFALTRGYPLYIWLLFKSNYLNTLDAKQNFSNQKGLLAIFNYEVSENGEIFKFWNEHLSLNCELINQNPPESPNLSYRILSYILLP